MSDTIEITFITVTGPHKFNIKTETITDPNTGYPYEFVSVHGRTWQMTFSSMIVDICEAFTPCPSEYNHRGIYQYNQTLQVYEIYNSMKKFCQKDH